MLENSLESLWARMHYFLETKSLPQAILLTASERFDLLNFVYEYITHIFCEASEPCGACPSCLRMAQKIHPDFILVEPEKEGSVIKIDQIRDLQQSIYQSPQCGKQRVIVIYHAEVLHLAAANALLKILEEPPTHTAFILIAKENHALPLTIKSRCQQYALSIDVDNFPLIEGQETLLADFDSFLKKQYSCCQLANKWRHYALDDLLSFLYSMTRTWLIGVLRKQEHRFQAFQLLKQLDQVSTLVKLRQANISLNETLALEQLLLGYLS